MPDWTWQTVFRPLMTRVPYAVADRLVFGSLGLLGQFAVGRGLIRFLGHARPDPELNWTYRQHTFPARCGLGCGVDQSAQAVSATSLFGFGLIEVGPVCVEEQPEQHTGVEPTARWHDSSGEICLPPQGAVSTAELVRQLTRNRIRHGVPVIARLDRCPTADDEWLQIREALDALVDGYSIPLSGELSPDLCRMFAQQDTTSPRPLILLVVDPANELHIETDRYNVDGILLQGGLDGNGRRGGISCSDRALLKRTVQHWTSGPQPPLVVTSGGVAEPADAHVLLEAGADLVLVDSGLAISGPGLPKRINHNQQAKLSQVRPISASTADDWPQQSWFWAAGQGLSLTLGGAATLLLGCTQVLLPYDEQYLGLAQEEICSINDRLLSFMAHDRVTLAGTMLALGPLYLSLAWYGDRRGMHWARVAFLASSLVGFASFFLFLGFGYFDPFHAFLAAVMVQFTLLCLRSRQPQQQLPALDLVNSPRWHRALWGQLLMVLHGIAVLTAGVVICSYGVTTVFVPEDLAFMQTTREYLVSANPRLVPLVAHDRASFGGMLLSTGLLVTLTALWGWQRSQRWLWYALTVSGSVAYLCTILIHWQVGYTSLKHLAPAYAGLFSLWLAMGLSRGWLLEDDSVTAAG